MARETLADRQRTLGPANPDTFGSMATLADVVRDEGDAAGASALYDQAWQGLWQTLGPDHPETLGVLYEYSLLLKSQRQEIEARRLAHKLMSGTRRRLPQNHPDRLKYQRLLDSLR